MSVGVSVHHGPARGGILVGLAAGVLAVAAVADAQAQLVALGAEGVAALVFLVGGWRFRAGDRLLGVPLALAGAVGLAAAVGYAAATVAPSIRLIELLPGMVGLALLCAGGVPLRRGRARPLVAVGAACLVVSVLASGVVRDAGRLRLLVGLVLAILAWDAAEQACSLGEQVGRRGAGLRPVATHGFGSLGVGAVGVVAALGVATVDVTGLPLLAVVALLAGAVALATAAFT